MTSDKLKQFLQDGAYKDTNGKWLVVTLEDALKTLADQDQISRADEREKLIQILYSLDWVKVMRDAYEGRKTSWEEIGHIREWRNATDEIMGAVIKQVKEAIASGVEVKG
jgi:hypothetical protein